jgi:hypothetical protein
MSYIKFHNNLFGSFVNRIAGCLVRHDFSLCNNLLRTLCEEYKKPEVRKAGT